MLPGDFSLCIPVEVLAESVDSVEELRLLRKDICSVLGPLVSATQSMLSKRGELYHSNAGARAVPNPHAAPNRPRRSRTFPILEIPGFVISRTPRQPAPRNRHGTACPDRQLRQTRIRFTPGSRSPGGARRAPPTLGLCYIQELVATGWGVRGIDLHAGPSERSGVV